MYQQCVWTVCVLALVWALTASAGVAEGRGTVEIGQQKQLFVDDYIIDEMQNVSQVLNPVTKYPGNPVLRPDRAWEGLQVYMYGSVIYDDDEDLFKMWYIGWAPSSINCCYATSEDGINWQKPELGIVDFQGSKRNNCINWVGMGMIYSPNDPDPGKRYKSIIGRRGGFSADGLTWHVPPESQDIPGDIVSDNVIPFCYDEQSRRYVAFPKVNRESGGHLRRSVSVSFSDDFLTWTPVQTILVPDERDDELADQRVAALREPHFDDGPEWHLAQFYGHCGFPYEGMYLGLLWVFDISGWCPEMAEVQGRRAGVGGEDGPVQVELTSSRDLVHWQRVGERQPLIPLGEAGSYDSGQIYTTNRPLIVGDEIWIYYGGIRNTHGHPLYWREETDRFPRILEAIERASPRTGGTINLAKLRLDGWVSVDAGDEPGTLTTKPLKFAGDKLVINAEAQDGWIGVEILGRSGQRPVPGFSLADCERFSGDSVRHTVKWRGNSDLSRLQGRPVRLRFHLQNAKLYSFVFR